MQLQISFRDIAPSPAVEARVRAKMEHLTKLYRSRLVSCRITLGESSRNPNPRANSYFCHIDLRMPGHEIVAGRPADDRGMRDAHKERKDLYIAIRDAFDEAERLLREHVRILRGHAGHRRRVDRMSILAAEPDEAVTTAVSAPARSEAEAEPDGLFDTDWNIAAG